MTPLTSILIPVFNERLHIEECLASIREPAGYPIEVIVVDDQSTDDTFAIVETFIAEHGAQDWLTVLRNPVKGKAAAVNLAFSHARGEQFLLVGGDDRLVSAALPARIDAVRAGEPAVALCRYVSFSDNPALDGIVYPRRGREDHLAGGATSFNRAFADLYFPIPTELPNEDTWLRAVAILFGVRHRFIDTIGLEYRLHAGNSTGLTRSFAQTDEVLRRRHAAFGIALRSFPGKGTEDGRARLGLLERAEKLRAARRWLRIAALRGLEPGDRTVMLVNSAGWLYALKMRVVPWLKGVRGNS